MESKLSKDFIMLLYFSKRSLGRLFGMSSSIENEAPSARGVFDPQQRQPYVSSYLDNRLSHFDKVDYCIMLMAVFHLVEKPQSYS